MGDPNISAGAWVKNTFLLRDVCSYLEVTLFSFDKLCIVSLILERKDGDTKNYIGIVCLQTLYVRYALICCASQKYWQAPISKFLTDLLYIKLSCIG